MMLYSIIPYEVVFGNTQIEPSKFDEIEYMGEKVQVYSNEKKEYVINRIISTSPKAFLNNNLQPGSIVNSGIIKKL